MKEYANTVQLHPLTMKSSLVPRLSSARVKFNARPLNPLQHERRESLVRDAIIISSRGRKGIMNVGAPRTNDGPMVKHMRFAVYVKSKSSMHTAGHLDHSLHGGLTNSSMNRSTTACGACGCVFVDVVHVVVCLPT